MSTKGVCDKEKISYSKAGELVSKLVKAGLTPDLAQEIIVSPGNRLAMVALHAIFGNRVQKPSSSKRKIGGDLLRRVDMVTVEEQKEPFVLKDATNGALAGAKLQEAFRVHFLNGRGIIDSPMSVHRLKVDQLLKVASNEQIVSELGGKSLAETTFSEMCAVLYDSYSSAQAIRDLLWNSGAWGVFYIRDQRGELCSVAARPEIDDWFIIVEPAKGKGRNWGAGTYIFSRVPE